MIDKLIHCLRYSSKTRLGILPEKRKGKPLHVMPWAYLRGRLRSGTVRSTSGSIERYVNTESGRNYRVTYHREYESTNRICERRSCCALPARDVVYVRQRVCSRYRYQCVIVICSRI